MSQAYALLWWIPVGAGSRVVPYTSRLWERAEALVNRRRPRALFHAALEIVTGDERFLVEMAPAWGVPAPVRGVVATGPVALTTLGRSHFFRYEVRSWKDGVLPDREWAVGGPRRIELSGSQAEEMLQAVPRVPRLIWGRRTRGSREMWNSNSLIAWLMHEGGIDATQFSPPSEGWAPGWSTGIAVATHPL